MEFELFSLPTLLALLSLLLLLTNFISKSKSNQPGPPPSPRRLPIIGNMHQLAGDLPFRALRDLSRKHGPLIQLKVGQIYMVVASSKETAEEVLKIQDLNFASRPEMTAARIIAYNSTDIAFSPYGPYWKQLRKLCYMELLGIKRVRSYGAVRVEEISKFLQSISEKSNGTPINLTSKLYELTNNIVSRAAFGKKRDNHDRFLEVAKDALELASLFTFSDTFPSLKFLDVLTGSKAKMLRVRRELDDTFNEIIKDHLEKKKGSEEQVEDLVDVLLRLKEDPGLEIPMTMDNVKAVILDLFIAGTETSASVVEWAMSELIKNPNIMSKVQTEVRETLKNKTDIQETDLANLNYMRLVIKETLRIHPPVPLLIPRVCKETCTVLGYRISAGTRMLVNAWAISHDPLYWEEPEAFKPERFENTDFDYKGSCFEYLPFGAGRRICPGMTFGLASVDLVLAKLLYHFDWKLPEGMRAEELDMTETFGSNASRKTPLVLCAKNRFPLSGEA
ncbi:hypothetical protein LUZ60_000868 [Juncus effusus]|nr:hypothetical protein LUZ60_000868 [Juncus effusus]